MTGWAYNGPLALTTVTAVCVRWTHVPVQPQFLSDRQPGAVELQPGLIHTTSYPQTHTRWLGCLRAEVTVAYLPVRLGDNYWLVRTHAGWTGTHERDGETSKNPFLWRSFGRMNVAAFCTNTNQIESESKQWAESHYIARRGELEIILCMVGH